MKNIKKLVAGIALFGIVLSSIVHATNAPIDSAVSWVTLSNAWVADAVTETLTLTWVTKDFSADNVNYYEIKKNDGTIVKTDTTVSTNGSNTFTIVFDFDSVLDTSTRYTIGFKTVSGDFGGAVLVVNTDSNLTVTGIVLPVLQFELEATSKDFGVLTTSYGAVSTGVEVGTNAVNWVTVTAKSINGGLNSAAVGHTIGLTGNDTLYSNESYQFQSQVGTTDSVSGASIAGVVYTTVNTANQVVTVYTADKPQNFDTAGGYDTDFGAQIRIAASTPAATDYSDTIVFTATGNF